MIYLDSSASSYKKPRVVLRRTIKALKKYNFNIGRGSYKPAIFCSLKVNELREEIHRFVRNDSSSNVIITKSCTEAINLALLGSVKKNGHIITSVLEHNSVLRTLEYLKKEYNVKVTYLKPNQNGQINLEELEKKINENTYLIVINHVSNVSGATQDIKNIGKICKNHKLLFMLDGAQSCGKTIIDMHKYHINFYSIAGHKGFYSLQGIGLLVCNSIKKLRPLINGGTGTKSFRLIQPTDFPDGFEAGTQSVPLIYSLLYGIKYVKRNFNKINNKIENLSRFLLKNLNQLKNKYNKSIDFKIISNNPKHGIISLYFKDFDSSLISDRLNDYNICVRGGYHCAPLYHKFLKTQDHGMVRISLNYFNKIIELKYFIKKLNLILEELNKIKKDIVK